MTDRFSASTQLVIYLKVSLPQSQFLILASLVAEVIRQAPRNIFRLLKAGHHFPLTGGAWSLPMSAVPRGSAFAVGISSHHTKHVEIHPP
jgi:hypothetical protein